MAPQRGAIFHQVASSLVPVMTPDHDAAVVIIARVIPSAVQAAVVLIESHARSAVVTAAVIVAVAAHIDAEPAGARCCRYTDGKRCQGSQRVRELSHCSSPLVVTWRERMPRRFCCREQ